MNAVTAYTTGPSCQRCKLTQRRPKGQGRALTEVDIREHPAAREYVVDELGYTRASVVVVDEHDHWSGFRPDQIERIARS